MSKLEAPNLDRLAILDDQGRRRKLHPIETTGRFAHRKLFVRWALIALWAALPWIEIGGQPAVLLDLPLRRFTLFGHVFGPADSPFLFFLATGVGFVLIFVSAMWGRVWCGWACPQTVFLEGVYRRIERRIEGDGLARLALDSSRWTVRKIALKAVKHALFLVVSFVIAHILLSYFVSLPRVLQMIVDDPRDNLEPFGWAAAVTLVVHFNFIWFREQTCLIICPYGRLQSALQDRDTWVVGYDAARGEPRGHKGEPGVHGACVDCRKCIAVCPTGIDIRNGLQMECIGCAACIEVCDDVMHKLQREPGLIRYDTERGFAGKKRVFFRPRLYAYAVAGAVGLAVLAGFATTRTPFFARVQRPQGVPFILVDGMVQNQVMVHVQNRSSVDHSLALRVEHDPDVQVFTPQRAIHLEPLQIHDLPIVARAPLASWRGPRKATIVLEESDGPRVELPLQILGPPR